MFGWGDKGKKSKTPEDRFWSDFQKNAPKLERLYEAHKDGKGTLNEMVSIVGTLLWAYDENLSYEVGHDGERFDLVISADGIRSNIRSVLTLVRAMPPIDHWKVTPFRPPLDKPEDVTLSMGGTTVTTDIARFALATPHDGKCDIILVLKAGSLPNDMDLRIPGFHFLDMVLGEYDVMTRIGNIEFGTYDESQAEQFSPLGQLREELNALLPATPN